MQKRTLSSALGALWLIGLAQPGLAQEPVTVPSGTTILASTPGTLNGIGRPTAL